MTDQYPDSRVEHAGATFWMEPGEGHGVLAVSGAEASVLERFAGAPDGDVFKAPATVENAVALRETLPWLKPTTFGLETSAGFGDRIGNCTPGHVQALKQVDPLIRPNFAQQSIREMTRTHRTPADVLADATWGAFKAGWTSPVGTDADHLKTFEDIDRCAEAGYVNFTFDPGEYVDAEAHDGDAALCVRKAEALDWSSLETDLESTKKRYVGMTVDLEDTSISLDEEAVVRAFAKYGASIAHAVAMARHLDGLGFEHTVEMAVDETDFPTTPAEHVIIVNEYNRLGARFTGLAPRFIGQFEKGVEFIGDFDELDRDFRIHAQIAKALGPYKLSLHSGSDKFRIYPLIAAATDGMVHLKTAGTSWVEALRVVADHDPELMNDIYQLSRADFETNRKSYHLSTDMAKVPADPKPGDFAELIDAFDSRQVLHVGYGPALTQFGDRIKAVLHANESELDAVIRRHFVRHLEPFAKTA